MATLDPQHIHDAVAAVGVGTAAEQDAETQERGHVDPASVTVR